ncbi:MAG TPA: protein-glutamate O-methyltransferase [Terracidiphilus sp.]|jgi:chemotaxis protein methyltransferase CheR|nr:protein-glutamate O-methyltransferase [Terracidiphilus sp.]
MKWEGRWLKLPRERNGEAHAVHGLKMMEGDQEGISRSDYGRLCTLIHAEAGIHLGPDRGTMLEIRIKRRLKALDLDSYSDYCEYLFGQQGRTRELVHLIDVVTTNKTDFFREPKHFEYLIATALPDLMRRVAAGRALVVWSAGCSTGEEPYTLAMLLSEYAQNHPGFRFRIIASDISTVVLEKARLGIYAEEVAEPVPAVLRRRYFLRGRDAKMRQVRVVPEIRRLVEFRYLNFMDDDYRLAESADVIFCRNVIIYFNRETQEKILRKLAGCLIGGGYLFVGHAETLHTMRLPLKPVGPSLYRKAGDDA